MKPADTARIALIAVTVLDEAYQQSRQSPIERTDMHRLALGYLVLTDLTNAPQSRTIWQMLGHENGFDQMSCRQAYYGPVFNGIKDRAKKMAEGK